MAKREKKQKTRFKEEQDPTGGWGQTTPSDDPWGPPPAQTGWGQTDESSWAAGGGGGGGGWGDNSATGGGEKDHNRTSWGQTQPTTFNGQNVPQNDLNKAKTLRKSSAPASRAQKVPFPQHQQNKPQARQGIPTLKSQQNMDHHQHYGTMPDQRGSTWDIPEEDEDELEYVDDEEWGYPDNQPQHQQGYSPEPLPYFPSPSKTFSNAVRSPRIGKSFDIPPIAQNHRLIESQGAALSVAHTALYSPDRLAKERFHWSFSPHKDERVQSVLQWIEGMSEGVGALGLHKFLQTRERGALFVNADFRPHQSAKEPAFDWLPLDHLKDTMDKILQESVAFYDPGTQVIVFVFLLSKSGNSMAIWRRKIPVAEVFRTMYAEVIDETIANLRADDSVYVDELPSKTKKHRVLSKRKWWKPWLPKSGP